MAKFSKIFQLFCERFRDLSWLSLQEVPIADIQSNLFVALSPLKCHRWFEPRVNLCSLFSIVSWKFVATRRTQSFDKPFIELIVLDSRLYRRGLYGNAWRTFSLALFFPRIMHFNIARLCRSCLTDSNNPSNSCPGNWHFVFLIRQVSFVVWSNRNGAGIIP